MEILSKSQRVMELTQYPLMYSSLWTTFTMGQNRNREKKIDGHTFMGAWLDYYTDFFSWSLGLSRSVSCS